MKHLTFLVSVFLVFQRALHHSEYQRASNTIDKFLWKRHQCPHLLQFHVSVILNGFDKTFFHGFLLKETDVMFSHGTFATATVAAWENSRSVLDIHSSNPVVLLFLGRMQNMDPRSMDHHYGPCQWTTLTYIYIHTSLFTLGF